LATHRGHRLLCTHFFFLRAACTLLGLPAGWPRRFFCAIRLRFSDVVISDDVLGVLLDTRFVGLQYGVPRFSPFLRPQALPVRTSFQSSLNQRLRAAPFAVLRTATLSTPILSAFLTTLSDSARGIGGWEDLVPRFDLFVAGILNGATLGHTLPNLTHATALHHITSS